MKADLTDAFLRAIIAPESGRIEIADAKRPGLSLRVYAGGRRVWMFEKRVRHGPKRKHTLGEYPRPVSLADARREAEAIAAEAARGFDRVAEAEKARYAAEATEAAKITVAATIDRYDALHLSPNLRTAADRKRQLEQALSAHMDRSIADLTRAHLQAVIDAKAKAGRAIMANRIKSALSAFTRWAWRRGYTETDAGAGLSKAVSEKPRDVVLSVAQVREIWAATFKLGDPWGPLFRLLLVTAQRRGDIGGLRWSEVNADRLEISAARTKNGKPHIVHLSELARRELDALPRENDLVFTTTGKTPVSGFSRAKARLDRHLGEHFPPWRLHDLRTAFATAMAESGESEAVVDRILNHVASVSAASAVARVYNRAHQLPQRARALDRWADLIAPGSDVVVNLPSRSIST